MSILYLMAAEPEFGPHLRARIAPVMIGIGPVEAAINGVAWRTSIFPQKSGGYILPIKADVRKRTGVAAGDEVTLSLNLL